MGRALEGVEREKADARKLANLKQNSTDVDQGPAREEEGRSRDAVGQTLGCSGKNAPTIPKKYFP